MKVSRHYEHRKRMARVAKPILEGMLSELEDDEKRSLIKNAIRKTQRASILELVEDKLRETGDDIPGKIKGTCNRFSRKMKFRKDCPYKTYAHELIHHLYDRFNNDYILAHAIGTYISSSKNVNSNNNETERLQYPKLPEEDKMIAVEYISGYDQIGRILGLRARAIESEIEIPGSGLFYLKLVDSGISPKEAEEKVRSGDVAGMKKFSKKYGMRWEKIIKSK